METTQCVGLYKYLKFARVTDENWLRINSTQNEKQREISQEIRHAEGVELIHCIPIDVGLSKTLSRRRTLWSVVLECFQWYCSFFFAIAKFAFASLIWCSVSFKQDF
jgi:hypothetical protein